MSETIAFGHIGAHTLAGSRHAAVVLAGNPNTGKTSLFNTLTGIRAKTANFPGTTVEIRKGRLEGAQRPVTLIDLPGLYSMHATTPDEAVAREVLMAEDRPDAVIAVVDATHLERNLLLASQLMELDVPVIVTLTMMDVVARRGMHIDIAALESEFRCPVVAVSARTGQGIETLRESVFALLGMEPGTAPLPCLACRGCPLPHRFHWSEQLCRRCLSPPRNTTGASQQVERIDHVLTHPYLGVAAFAAMMMVVFFTIFQVAQWPMGWIDTLFGKAGGWIEAHLPEAWYTDLLANGVVAGVGSVLIFLPQIALLFFLLSLIEDTGYLARAALVMDRWMKKVGLPGKAFVPLLSAHACAIPAIMATRVMEQPRDRLVTILVAPLLSCSARLPVYIMIAGLLFPGSPSKAALLLSSSYLVGIGAALAAAFVFRRTILPGAHEPLLIELPDYRRPHLRSTLLYTLDRVWIFLQQAGTLILLFSMIMWFLASYPAAPTPDRADGGTHLSEESAVAHSYAGQAGRWIEPVIRPLGFDWQIGIGLIGSFAAREVLVSTLAVVYGLEEDAGEAEPDTFLTTLRNSTRGDGSPVFTVATCMSLLVFYILAAQCIPTQIITRRETGSWKWAFLQFGYMNALAYVAAWITFQGLRWFGWG